MPIVTAAPAAVMSTMAAVAVDVHVSLVMPAPVLSNLAPPLSFAVALVLAAHVMPAPDSETPVAPLVALAAPAVPAVGPSSSEAMVRVKKC